MSDSRGGRSNRVEAALIASRHRLMATLVARLGSVTEAEDVFQDFAVKVVAAADKGGANKSVDAWLRTVLKNTLSDHFRRLRTRRNADRALRVEPIEEGIEATVAETVCECLHGLLDTLPPAQGDLLSRIDLGDETIAEASRRLGVTENAIYVRLHRARRAMRESLRRTCVTCPDTGYLRCDCGGASARSRSADL